MLLNFKTYNTAALIKAVQYYCKNIQTGQWNRIQSSKLNGHKEIFMAR